jgi:hypothetical protein
MGSTSGALRISLKKEERCCSNFSINSPSSKGAWSETPP